METADEILQRLKDAKAAGKLLKRYKAAKKTRDGVEKYRPSLLGVIGAVPGRYEWNDYEKYRTRLAEVNIPQEDKSILQEYMDGLEIIDIVEVAIRQRIRTERENEAVDLFLKGDSIQCMRLRYGISEKTVKRLRKRGIEALEQELALRFGCGRVVKYENH